MRGMKPILFCINRASRGRLFGTAWPQTNTTERKMIAQRQDNEVKNQLKIIAARVGAILALGLAALHPAAAQTYPNKPVTLIVPFPAGGPIELLGRVIGTSLGERLGQPILVESRPGASSTIGAGYVAKAEPNGYTLLITGTTHTITASTMANVPYDAVNDFAPVILVGKMPMVVVTNNTVPANNLAEFTKYAKANPGKLNFATGSPGGTAHLVTAMYLQRAGLTMTDIPYKGSAPAVIDLIAIAEGRK